MMVGWISERLVSNQRWYLHKLNFIFSSIENVTAVPQKKKEHKPWNKMWIENVCT